MEFLTAFTDVPGELGSHVLFNAYKHVLEGGTIPALFAENKTVLFPSPPTLTTVEDV